MIETAAHLPIALRCIRGAGRVGLKRLIVAAGYDFATPVRSGVSSPSMTVLGAHGEGAGDRILDSDAVGYAGSLAKQITGACAALLVQDGTLDVDASIAKWLPELPPWASTIRVRLENATAALERFAAGKRGKIAVEIG